MQYLLYDIYNASNLTLEEIFNHYIKHFYLRKYGRDKAEKVISKISNSSKLKELFEISEKRGIVPNYVDFGSVINETAYFMFQSNSTQALAILAAALAWDKQINQQAHLISKESLRNDTIKIFKKYSIYGEMDQYEFKELTKPNAQKTIEEKSVDELDGDLEDTYHILNFYLDCSYWHMQNNEINKCPLVLPVKIVDVNEMSTVEKYEVLNLPTLILVDRDGVEIHRWVGVTPTSVINAYIIKNGYLKREA